MSTLLWNAGILIASVPEAEIMHGDHVPVSSHGGNPLGLLIPVALIWFMVWLYDRDEKAKEERNRAWERSIVQAGLNFYNRKPEQSPARGTGYESHGSP